LAGEFTIQYVELPNGRVPVREFLDSLDDKAAAKVAAIMERLRIHGTQIPAKFSKNLGNGLFELRVEHFDRIFRVFYFFQPGMLVVLASGFQKKTMGIPQIQIARAERLRTLWLKYKNRYPASPSEREKIAKEAGL
jgi:phage-related protein